MGIILNFFSYRFAEQVLNSKLALKQECEGILSDPSLEIEKLSRPNHFLIFLQYQNKQFC